MLTVSWEPQIPTLLATSQSLSTDSLRKKVWLNRPEETHCKTLDFLFYSPESQKPEEKKHNSLKVPQTIGKQVPRNCSFWMHMKWFPSVTASVDIRVYSRCPPLRKRPSFLSQWLPLFVGWKGLRVIINVIMQDTTQAWLLEEMHIKM